MKLALNRLFYQLSLEVGLHTYPEPFLKYAIVFSKEKLSQIVHQLSLEVGLFT